MSTPTSNKTSVSMNNTAGMGTSPTASTVQPQNPLEQEHSGESDVEESRVSEDEAIPPVIPRVIQSRISQTALPPSGPPLDTDNMRFQGTLDDWARERYRLAQTPEGLRLLQSRSFMSSQVGADAAALAGQAERLPPPSQRSRQSGREDYPAMSTSYVASSLLEGVGAFRTSSIPIKPQPTTTLPPAWYTRGSPGWVAPYSGEGLLKHGTTGCVSCNAIWDGRSGVLYHQDGCPESNKPLPAGRTYRRR